MDTTESKIKEFEKNFRDTLTSKLLSVHSKQLDCINVINKNLENLGFPSVNFTNAGTVAHNKIQELSREFNNAGLSMFCSVDKKTNLFKSSRIGYSITNDILDNLLDSTQKINALNETVEKVGQSKVKRVKTKSRAHNKLMFKIKSLLNLNPNLDDLFLSENEQKNIQDSINTYEESCDEIYNYNLKDNLVPSLVNYLKHTYPGNIPFIIENDIIPDLRKLKLDYLLPDLQKALFEELKDNPDFDKSSFSKLAFKNSIHVDNIDNLTIDTNKQMNQKQIDEDLTK